MPIRPAPTPSRTRYAGAPVPAAADSVPAWPKIHPLSPPRFGDGRSGTPKPKRRGGGETFPAGRTLPARERTRRRSRTWHRYPGSKKQRRRGAPRRTSGRARNMRAGDRCGCAAGSLGRKPRWGRRVPAAHHVFAAERNGAKKSLDAPDVDVIIHGKHKGPNKWGGIRRAGSGVGSDRPPDPTLEEVPVEEEERKAPARASSASRRSANG